MEYKISFEIINPFSHPEAYDSNCKPKLKVEEIPNNWWHKIERISKNREDILDQAKGCEEFKQKGELIRNIKISIRETTEFSEITF